MANLRKTVRGALKEARLRLRTVVALRGIERKNPILVYQMGKVGSSTVVRTLEKMDLGVPILHVHTLDPVYLEKARRRQRSSSSPFLHEHLLVSRTLVRKLSRGLFPCRVITLVREPVARAVSFVFEDWHKKAPDALNSDSNLDAGSMRDAVEETLGSTSGISDPTIWFDNELKAILDVDVFSQPFDHEAGYTIFYSPVRTLAIRLEDLDRSLKPALSEFLDCSREEIRVADANVGASKWYSESLREVKTSFRMPPHIANRVLSTRYVRHFYPERIDELRARWTRSGAVDD